MAQTNVLIVSSDERDIAWLKRLLSAIGRSGVSLTEYGVRDEVDYPEAEDVRESLIQYVGEYRWLSGLAAIAERDGFWCIVVEDGCPYAIAYHAEDSDETRIAQFSAWVHAEEIF